MENLKKHAGLFAGLMLSLFFAVSLSVSWQESTTMDEKAHIPSAFTYVSFGDMRLNPEHPPLLKDLAGIPLRFMNLSFPTDSKEWQTGTNEQWVLGDKFIHGNNAELVTFWSRFPIILLAVLLGWFIFKWTKEIAGSIAALFALLLYAADPNVIAHGHYVTTDLGIAAFIFFSFYAFLRFLRTPSALNVAFFGVMLGLAQLAKFSSVLLFPYFGLIILVYSLTKSKPDDVPGSVAFFRLKELFFALLRYTASVAVCFALIYALYVPNTINMPGEKLPAIAHMMLNTENPLGRFAVAFVEATSGNVFLKPLSEFFLGVFMVFARVAGGNTYYFFGTVSNHATPWYFPAIFTVKETLPLLFLIVATSVYSLYRMGRHLFGRSATTWHREFARSFQTHILQWTMVGFIFLYSFVSITGNLNIGFRHLFPILPFLYVLIAKTCVDFIRHKNFQGEKASKAALGFIAAWVAVIPLLAYPYYLSYFNEAVGGHQNGYRYVTDSNFDWGQDVKRLRSFVNGFNDCKSGVVSGDGCAAFRGLLQYPSIDTVRVDYFGGTNPAYYLGDRYREWHVDAGKEPGWYAISVGFYQESTNKPEEPGHLSYRWLDEAGLSPVARAGDSILIYYVPPAAASDQAPHQAQP
ncbi:MAG TPA: glycosyltransferase family 39 protein [Candidatus Fimivivens sp.]|nr:glycosyltransferase family 39 protein [Candidatus Fimivivens sp.]